MRSTVRVRNLGETPIDDTTIFFTLIDARGQEYTGNDVTPVGPEPQFSGPIPAGQSRSGSVLFLVRDGAKPKEINWELSGETAASWVL